MHIAQYKRASEWNILCHSGAPFCRAWEGMALLVRFRTRKLRRWYEDSRMAMRRLGPVLARRYIGRIDAIHACESADDLYSISPFDFHPLKGNRAGQYSLTLHAGWRLIVSFSLDSTEIWIEEVTNHYDD
jgi:plasmid maintenance system killer protein